MTIQLGWILLIFLKKIAIFRRLLLTPFNIFNSVKNRNSKCVKRKIKKLTKKIKKQNT